MEITQQNFTQNLDLVFDSIDKADFISFDLEFSGFRDKEDDKPHYYNTEEEIYQKNRTVINKFRAFQVGICTFRWDPETHRYKYRPFSFLVWPKSKVRDQSMMFQVSRWIQFD